MVGDWRQITMTGGSTTTAISAEMRDFAEEDDSFSRWYMAMTTLAGTANSFASRVILRTGGYTYSTDTVTVGRTFGGTVANNDVGELHRYDPTLMNTMLARAQAWLFERGVYLPTQDETLVIDRIGSNMDMETFASSTFTNWTLSGAGATEAQETSRVLHGSSSMSFTAGGGATARQSQNLFTSINVREWVGKSLRLEGFVWATVADAVRLAITFDGTYTGANFFAGSYHGGDDEWEGPTTMYVDATVPANATECTILTECTAGNTAIVDSLAAYMKSDPINEYTIPTTFPTVPRLVLMQSDKNQPNSQYFKLSRHNPARSGHRIRLVGRGRLTEWTAETTSAEVSAEILDLVCAKAAAMMFAALALEPDGLDRAQMQDNAAYWEARAEEMLQSVSTPRDGVQVPDGFRYERTGETAQSLVLTAR